MLRRAGLLSGAQAEREASDAGTAQEADAAADFRQRLRERHPKREVSLLLTTLIIEKRAGVSASSTSVRLMNDRSPTTRSTGAPTSSGVSSRTLAEMVVRRAGRMAAWALALAGLAILVAMPVLVASIVGAVLGFGEVTILWLLLLVPATWAWVQSFMAVASPHLGALACFMFLTGARISEALAVTWAWLKWRAAAA